MQPIQMHLSQKQEKFSEFFFQFLKSIINFKHFKQKKTLIADVFPKLRTPKNVLNKISNRSHFKGHFNERFVEREEALLKSGRHHL